MKVRASVIVAPTAASVAGVLTWRHPTRFRLAHWPTLAVATPPESAASLVLSLARLLTSGPRWCRSFPPSSRCVDA